MNKPVIAIAIGDPAGIGPEIALAAVLDEGVHSRCRPILVGSTEVLELYRAQLKLSCTFREILAPDEAEPKVPTPGGLPPGLRGAGGGVKHHQASPF